MKTNKCFSIFISSTFLDMDAERDHLRDFVLKELQEIYEPQGVHIQLVDLRWGITTDVSDIKEREQKILQVCLDEIDRTYPFFIALLGDRYGWIPDETHYETYLFKQEERLINQDMAGTSVTELEITFGALCRQGALSRSLFFFRDSTSYDRVPTERKGFFQDQHSSESEDKKNVCIKRLQSLKQRIRKSLQDAELQENLIDYRLQWEDNKFIGLHEWGTTVKERLINVINNELSSYAETETLNPLEYFIGRSNYSFIGREEELSSFRPITPQSQYIITGESGCGKTSFMCKLYSLTKETVDDNTLILFYSVGSTDETQSVQHLLTTWLHQLQTWADNESLYQEEESLQVRFRKAIEWLQSQNKMVILMLDAVDRFLPEKGATHLPFFPDTMPVFISTLPAKVEALQLQHPAYRIYHLKSYAEKDARSLIEFRVKDAHKQLPEEIIDALQGKYDIVSASYTTPLWLVLATDTLLSLNENDFNLIRKRTEPEEQQKITGYLAEIVREIPGNPGDLFIYMINRAEKYFGRDYIRQILCYLVFTNDGVREADLSMLLGEGNWDSLAFAQFRRLFKGLIASNETTGQWHIAHNLLKDRIKDRLRTDKMKTHQKLKEHFLALPSNDIVRKSELVSHLMESNDKANFCEEMGQQSSYTPDYYMPFDRLFLQDTIYWTEWTREVFLYGFDHKLNSTLHDFSRHLRLFLGNEGMHQKGIYIISTVKEKINIEENLYEYSDYLILKELGELQKSVQAYKEAAETFKSSMDMHCLMMRMHRDHYVHSCVIGYLDLAQLYNYANDDEQALIYSLKCMEYIEEYQADFSFIGFIKHEPFQCRILRAGIFFEREEYRECHEELRFCNIAFHNNTEWKGQRGDMYTLLKWWAYIYTHINGGENIAVQIWEKLCQHWGTIRQEANDEWVSYIYLNLLFSLDEAYTRASNPSNREKQEALRFELFPLSVYFIQKGGRDDIEQKFKALLSKGIQAPAVRKKNLLSYFHYDFTTTDVLPESECLKNAETLLFYEGLQWLRNREFTLALYRFKTLSGKAETDIDRNVSDNYNIKFTSLCNYLICLLIEGKQEDFLNTIEKLPLEEQEDSDISDIQTLFRKYGAYDQALRTEGITIFFDGSLGYSL